MNNTQTHMYLHMINDLRFCSVFSVLIPDRHVMSGAKALHSFDFLHISVYEHEKPCRLFSFIPVTDVLYSRWQSSASLVKSSTFFFEDEKTFSNVDISHREGNRRTCRDASTQRCGGNRATAELVSHASVFLISSRLFLVLSLLSIAIPLANNPMRPVVIWLVSWLFLMYFELATWSGIVCLSV